jgi:hypothetical protein
MSLSYFTKNEYRTAFHCSVIYIGKGKLKLFIYRPGHALRVPAG